MASRHRSPLFHLYAARALRAFGDGFMVVVLPAYLTAIGLTPFQIGVVATAALLGSAALTLAVGLLFSGHRDLRGLLVAGAALMAATGAAFPAAEHLVYILVVAFVGTMNPSGGDVGVFVPLEHAMVAGTVRDDRRTRAFAGYSLAGALAGAAGALFAAVPDLADAHVARLTALKAMFIVYAGLGCAAAVLYARLPRARSEDAPSVPLGPSRAVVYRLAALFSVDSFAGGLAVPALIALWLFERFDLSLASTSVFFFWSNVLTALSYLAAARIAERIGLVNTMVFTHIPSSLCLLAAAFAPDLATVLGLLLVRAALSQMDVPTRTSFVMAVVTPAERPAAASVTAVPRSLAAAVGPALGGAMMATSFSALPLVVCGCLKIAYDVALLITFRAVKPPEES